jgi:transposase-like protein
MAMELDDYCPNCDAERTFWLVGSTEMQLGRKRKYHCGECDYGFVRIDNAVDTSSSA